MALPTTTKTWSYNVNDVQAVTSSRDRGLAIIYYGMKIHMVNAGWTVVASSNTVTVKNIGDASPDTWTSESDVIRHTTDASWIILYNSTMDVYWGMHYQTSVDYNCDIFYNTTGYNINGTVSTRPTAITNEEVIVDARIGLGGTTSSSRIVLHSQYSDDNLSFRLFARSNGSTNSGSLWLNIFRPSSAPDNWTSPVVVQFRFIYNDETEPTITSFYTNSTYTEAFVSGIAYNTYCTGESYSAIDNPFNRETNTNPADLSSTAGYLLLPMGLACITPGARGSLGTIDDLWWAPIEMTTGDTMSLSGDRLFVCLGDFVIPWNGSVPTME